MSAAGGGGLLTIDESEALDYLRRNGRLEDDVDSALIVGAVDRLLARLALAEAVVIAAHGVSASQAKLLPSNPPIDSERTVRIVYAPALRHLDERLAAYDAATAHGRAGEGV